MSPARLTDLPEELLELVVSFLDGLSALRVASTCSLLHRIVDQHRVWESLRRRGNLVIIQLCICSSLTLLFSR